jgi:hypothetical protein
MLFLSGKPIVADKAAETNGGNGEERAAAG